MTTRDLAVAQKGSGGARQVRVALGQAEKGAICPRPSGAPGALRLTFGPQTADLDDSGTDMHVSTRRVCWDVSRRRRGPKARPPKKATSVLSVFVYTYYIRYTI